MDGPLYQALDLTRPTIRLLKIKPSRNLYAEVECTLENVFLDRKPTYIALSYVWGDANDTEDIIVNGRTIAVTKNLKLALQHLRTVFIPKHVRWRAHKPRIWADAIAINQEDVEERSHQVQLMNEIYSRAEIVVAWMGVDDSTVISEAIKLISITAENVTLSQQGTANVSIRPWNRHSKEKRFFESIPFDKHYIFVRALFSVPYWRRSWVLQEMVAAKKLMFMYGSHMLRFEELDKWYVMHLRTVEMRRRQNGTETRASIVLPAGLSPLFKVKAIISDSGDSANIGALRIVTATYRCRATDPRDHIFALQGLMSNLILPDYRKLPRQVYCSFAQLYVEHLEYGLLWKFSGIGFRSRQNPFDLPSWVPDWHEIAERGKWPMLPGLRCRWEVLSTYGDVSPSGIQFSEESFVSLEGYVCDIITAIGPYYHDYADSAEEVWRDELFQFLQDCSRRTNTVYCRMNMKPMQAIFRTLLQWDKGLSPGHVMKVGSLASAFVSMLLVMDRTNGQSMLQPSDLENQFRRLGMPEGSQLEDFLEACDVPMDLSLKNGSDLAVALHPLAERISVSYSDCTSDFRLFSTKEGYIGWAPPDIRVHDMICILPDCLDPVVLRSEDSHHYFVGLAFVTSLMSGRYSDLSDRGLIDVETIEIR